MTTLERTTGNLTLRATVAEQLLGDVRWQTAALGYCTCPGAAHHTHRKTNRRECRVTLDGAPTLYCSHQSCAGVVAAMNADLRSRIAIAEQSGKTEPLTTGELMTRQREREAREQRERKEREARQRAADALPDILKYYAWSECAAWEASTIRIDCPPADDAKLMLRGLYRDADVIWSGETYDSGKPDHARHFRTVAEWLDSDDLTGPLICPATFKTDAIARTVENIQSRPYLVLEGDSADSVCREKQERGEPLTPDDKARNRAACLAVLNFLRLRACLNLRAVVDSGGKSAHGWFDLPCDGMMNELRMTLPALGFDPATLRPSQPVRLPGVRRADSGRWQRLLYLNPPTSCPQS